MGFIPLGFGCDRLLTTKGPPPESWAIRITEFLGTDAWKSEFYPGEEITTLFGTHQEEKRDADFDKIGAFFLARLQQLFAAVAGRPLVLRNSTNVPIFLLCFAVGNPRGAPIAVKIAQQIIGG